ncbi:MAG: carbohydrate ABC transporter substrate-binding protein [Ruminococcus sp.]|nr:carbohydrate ABC transporter substrate-binding protein [Ruminococcus sp.]
MKYSRLIIPLLTAAVMALSACGETDEIEVARPVSISFSWWGKDVRHGYTLPAIKDFVLMNPEIEVITEYSEFDPFQRKMDVEFAAHDECDVMQINYDWLFRYSPDGTGFYDLNELSEYIKLDNFSEDELSYGMINGRLNGISNALNTETCYFNADIYASYGLPVPDTWDALFNAAEFMAADGVYPIELNRKSSWLCCIAHEEQQTGVRCFDKDGSLTFTQENFEHMLEFYKRMIDHRVTKYVNDIDKQDFIDGVSAGAVYWISDAGYYCQPLIDKGMNIVVGEYLRIPNSELSGWYAKPTSLYCIRRDTPAPEAAAKLVNFLLNSEEMAKYQGTEKGIPLSRSMLEVLEADSKLNGVQYTANQMLLSSPQVERISPYLENNTLLTAFDNAVKSVLFDGGDIAEQAQTVYETAQALVD